MSSKYQKTAFLDYEANAWFERNKEYIQNYKGENDPILTLLKNYRCKPEQVLEIGCSAGYRLNAVGNEFKCRVIGVEPSSSAIEFGKKQYSQVEFVKGAADNLSELEDASMDVVIVGFVFYVIDRNLLFKVISEIDRVLKNEGLLIIVDFFSETSLKSAYEYIADFSAYSFKQNYDEIFTSSKLYYLLDKSTWNHSSKTLDASNNYYDKYSITLLKKDINASYK